MVDKLTDFYSSHSFCEIYSKAEKAIEAYGMRDMINSGVIVGLSGGADSVMLLLFLLEYRRKKGNFRIIAFHVNHMIRGGEAMRDEEFSRKLSSSLGVEFISKKVDVPRFAIEKSLSLEEAARDVRYKAFYHLLSMREDVGCIAVAHNSTDNAETSIFNILRGSGSRGAAGIRPVRDTVIRPLITVSKLEIVTALDSFGIGYVTDSTNLQTDYSRNFIRHNIMPEMRRIISKPEEMFLRLSENLRSDDSFISSVADEFVKNGSVCASDYKKLHFAVFVRVIGKMCSVFSVTPSANQLSSLYTLLQNTNSFSYTVRGDLRFVLESGRFYLTNRKGSPHEYHFSVGQGVTDLSGYFADFILSTDKIEKTSLKVYKISIQADLSSAIIVGELFIRPKMDGDYVFYGGHTHKLKKLFNDKKIPPSKRTLIPVLCDEKGVVWIPGFGVRDDRGSDVAPKNTLYAALCIRNEGSPNEERMMIASEF